MPTQNTTKQTTQNKTTAGKAANKTDNTRSMPTSQTQAKRDNKR